MARVVVLGSSGFDMTIRLPRLPAPGETLSAGELLTGLGGKGANQAIAARRGGAEVLFATAFGGDEFGRRARENLITAGIDLSHSRVYEGEANQVALIFVGEADGQNLIGVAPGASGRLSPEEVEALPFAAFRDARVLLTCLEIRPETVEAGLRRAKAEGLTTVLNPAPFHPGIEALLALVDVLTPNETELRALSDAEIAGVGASATAARRLIERGVGSLVLTRGENGCLAVDRDGEAWSFAGHRVQAIDTVGAGDAFNGVLATGLAEGLPWLEACRRANAAGALAVAKPGAQGGLPAREEIDRLLAERPIEPIRENV